MAFIIADSGSTKTDWYLCNESTVLGTVRTVGFNPYFQESHEIAQAIRLEVLPRFQDHISTDTPVYYYGTGCSTEKNCGIVRQSLNASLRSNNIYVTHDLLAAARALCGRSAGIAAILGTGSNSGLYDGSSIIENVPSTGYLWSDYGGGSQIGKFLVREYFEGRMPADLREVFEKEGYNREVILENTYRSPLPSRYLASVSMFAARHHTHPLVHAVLTECFDSFFDQQVSKYTNSKKYMVHTIGSVGFHYQDMLRQVAGRHGYTMGKMIQSPMEGLIAFHRHS